MNPIRFRAWDKLLKEFLPNVQNHINNEWAFGNMIKNDRWNINQFTHLYDIHNKEIYEGDIVKWFSGKYTTKDSSKEKESSELFLGWDHNKDDTFEFEKEGWVKEYDIGVVVFYNGEFCIHYDIDLEYHIQNSFYNKTSYYGSLKPDKNYYEIIGNYYEHSHLLNNLKNIPLDWLKEKL